MRTVQRQKLLSLGIVLAVVGAIVTALLPPWILGSIVDSITGGNNVPVTLIMGFSLLSASEFLQTEKWRCAKQ